MKSSTRKIIDYNGAHEVTGICINTLYGLVSRRKIPHMRISARLVRFVKRELEEWLDSRRVAVTSEEAHHDR